MTPRMNRQYYGSFHWKGTQHVVVETFGDTITRIHVSSWPYSLWFTLEEFDPERLNTEQLHHYDRANKLHINALILVTNVLLNQSDDDIKSGKWYASINQTWPGDERLIEEPLY